MLTIDLKDAALRCVVKAENVIDFGHYTGILLLHGLARLGVLTADEAILNSARKHLAPFVRGEREFHANFQNYLCGGNGTAWLLMQGKLPEAEAAVRTYAEEALHDAPRDRNGILCHPGFPGEDRIWIDVAFAVTPFLAYAGRYFREERYLEEAWQQTAKMIRLFQYPDTGLLHQSRNFRGQGHMSEDHWSRGNGWGIFALTELVHALPECDPRRPEAEALFIDLCHSCLKAQDEDGMFHQELTDHRSYVETSGTGLILYAFGVGLELGLLDTRFRAAFEKGIRGYLGYIALDGSVHHTCQGCLCPGQGTIEDYVAMPHPVNDPHAFGPPVLCFGQAIALGTATIDMNDHKGD